VDHAHRSALKKFGLLCDWVREDLVESIDPFKESDDHLAVSAIDIICSG
jgi:hypothetical protein